MVVASLVNMMRLEPHTAGGRIPPIIPKPGSNHTASLLRWKIKNILGTGVLEDMLVSKVGEEEWNCSTCYAASW